MTSAPQSKPESPGLHLATITHEGLLWDTYLDFEEDARQSRSYRARLRFDAAAAATSVASTSTTVIIIEESYEAAVATARRLDDRQLASLLRSALPDGK